MNVRNRIVSLSMKGVLTVAASLLAATSYAANCAKNPSHKDCGGGEPPGEGPLATFDVLLVGDLGGVPLIDPSVCATSGTEVGNSGDPDVWQFHQGNFDSLRGELLKVGETEAPVSSLPGADVDQMYGYGHGELTAEDDAYISARLQGTGAGDGAINRVTMPGPDRRVTGCDDGNETTAYRSYIWLFLDNSVCSDPRPEGAVCVVDHQVNVYLDTGGEARQAGSGGFDAKWLRTSPGDCTILPLYHRDEMRKKGKKGANLGTMSVGELRLRAAGGTATACE